MKVYVVVDQDYEVVTDVKVYSDKKFILDKLYNEIKEYINLLGSPDDQKRIWLDHLENAYKEENLSYFRIFERDVQDKTSLESKW